MRKRFRMGMCEQRRTSRVTLLNQTSSLKYHQLYKLQTPHTNTSIEVNMNKPVVRRHTNCIDLQKQMRDFVLKPVSHCKDYR